MKCIDFLLQMYLMTRMSQAEWESIKQQWHWGEKHRDPFCYKLLHKVAVSHFLLLVRRHCSLDSVGLMNLRFRFSESWFELNIFLFYSDNEHWVSTIQLLYTITSAIDILCVMIFQEKLRDDLLKAMHLNFLRSKLPLVSH